MPTKSHPFIVLLSCGCFFSGRTLITSDSCQEHTEEAKDGANDQV